MNYIIVPEDTYTVSAGGYKIKYRDVYKNINYESETNTSEYFISKYIDNIKSSLSLNESCYTYNYNQNYMTVDYYDTDTQKNLFLLSTTAELATENYWMYPLSPDGRALNTMNFPVTRTISIVINSNTLPVYNIPNDITLGMDVIGSYKELIIPAGDYTYSTMNDLIYNFVNTFNNDCSKYLYYVNAEYFEYSRLVSRTDVNETEYTGASLVIHNNDEFNKYYGLLHMIYTYPENHSIITTNESRRFSANMPPVYRSLHIPEGEYTVEDFIDYINNNSEYHYTCNGVNTYSYTQFLAKVVDNDIVIYTDDGTEFFINPICKMNTYQETNFASEHRLCSKSHIKVNITQENTIRYNFDTISVSPSNYKEIFIENPWYLDTSEAPDFINIVNKYENNNLNTIEVPEDTYTVSNYPAKYTRWNTTDTRTFTVNYSGTHEEILNYVYNTNFNYSNAVIKISKYYYTYFNPNHEFEFTYSNDNYSPTENNYILLPIKYRNVTNIGQYQYTPLIKTISITIDSNQFHMYVDSDTINGFYKYSSLQISIQSGDTTYNNYANKILSKTKNTYDYEGKYVDENYNYTNYTTFRYEGHYFFGTQFDTLYGIFHMLYPTKTILYHSTIGPANCRCMSVKEGIWNINNFIDYVNNTDNEKLFTCQSTEHEILINCETPFILNPICSITKLNESDISQTFQNSKRILYNPQYKEINCTVIYNGTTYTISGRYTPAELLREIKTLTNADIEVYNNNDEYNINFPEGLTISDNPFFTSTENLSGLSRMDFTISNYISNFSYNDYIVNTTNTTHEVSISPIEFVSISTISANNLPSGLQIDLQGNITGTINYSDTTDGKISETITVNYTTSSGTSKSTSFKLFVNFMNIDYEINNTIINEFDCHIDDIIVLESTNVRGSITSVSILESDLTVTMEDNYDLTINAGATSGMYVLTVNLTDEKGQTVEKEITVNVIIKPSLNYNDKYYYTGDNVLIEPSYICSKAITWNYSNLPEGLSFNNGIISGKPKYSGDYNITVTLIESLNNHECEYNSVSDSFTISITSFCYSQSEYTFTVNKYVSIIPDSGDYTYSLSGNLPCGLTFGSDGSITGVCDHPVITVLSITISSSEITKTVELTLTIKPRQKCKDNIYSKYYVDNELNKCEAIIDKGFGNEYEFTLNDNELNGLVGPYMYILPPNHAVDLNIQTITDDNYETNNNNVNCYIKGFPCNEQSNYIYSLEDISNYGDYSGYVAVRNIKTLEYVEQSDVFDLSNLDFTGIINYFNERSTEQLSITSDEYCIYLHGVNFTIPKDDYRYATQYFYESQIALESNSTISDNKILLILASNFISFHMYYNNTICFTRTPDGAPLSFNIPSSLVNNGHILCSYVNEYTYPITLYMDVVAPLAEQNASDLKTMYQVSKFVYEVSNINYDLTEFTIPIGCYFTTTPVTEIEGPYVLEGVLPDGLIFDPDTGNISGTCNEIINSSVNIVTGDTSVQLTFNTIRIQTYSTKYIIHYKEETNIEPITPVTNYFGDGVITYENELPSGCTFDTSTGVITITSANKFENISINCIQSLDNTELRISSNILIRVMFSTQLEDNIFKYS